MIHMFFGRRGLVLISIYLALTALKLICEALRRLRLLTVQQPQPLVPPQGLSVIIPERQNPQRLEACLCSLDESCRNVSIPVEVLVVVNGCPPDPYERLQKQFPAVRWFHSTEPLWFAGAVRKGLEKSRFDWVYLLNDDMVLHPLALSEVLKGVGPLVFAVASQIFPEDPRKIREETGLTLLRFREGLVEVDHTDPDHQSLRDILYAGGGSSLFHKTSLMRFMGHVDPYHPGYWEDTEWGLLAWKHGYRVLLAPGSHVWHTYQATHSRLFAMEELRRIFERNRLLFQMRNAVMGGSDYSLFRKLNELDERSFAELVSLRSVRRMFLARARSYAYCFALVDSALRPYSIKGWLPLPLSGLWDGVRRQNRNLELRRRWGRLTERMGNAVSKLRRRWGQLTKRTGNAVSKLRSSLQVRFDWRHYSLASLSVSLDCLDRACEWLKRWGLRPKWTASERSSCKGLSVIIPERQNPELLSDCLSSLTEATKHVSEPVEVIVVVNGSDRRTYAGLMNRYPEVRWLFFAKALWFSGAIRQGLKVARYDWVYLLNDDMVLHPQALKEIAMWRAPHVFGIASQIFFKDTDRRREETGWTQFRWSSGRFDIFDAGVEDLRTVRGTLYAGGGSSLFQRRLLQRMMGRRDAYLPFYWEDVEWGIRAWRLGYEVLFCPDSRVWHSHRATYRKLFVEAEIDRIFVRNGFQFQLRNRLNDRRLFSHLQRLDRRSLIELLRPSELLALLVCRTRCHFLPFSEMDLEHVWKKYYFQPFGYEPDKPEVLLVSPFAIYPPCHGGAVRIHHLIETLQKTFRLVVLSDEAETYGDASWKYCQKLASLHLVSGRRESGEQQNRISRIQSHCHRALRQQAEFLLECYHPELVQIEFIELAQMIDLRRNGTPWVLTLHDVLLAEKVAERSLEDRYELQLIGQYDALVACSHQDAALLEMPRVNVIANGADCAQAYEPSPAETRVLLFMGPFRYEPNLLGICSFLKCVYPRLLCRIPELKLWVLGGNDAPALAARRDDFQQEGICVFDYVEDPGEYLSRCAVTLNPVQGIRGSSLKVIESIAAGRVCVSTTEGARGFCEQKWSSLWIVERVEDFEEPLEQLLMNPPFRHSIERVPEKALYPFSWAASGSAMAELYRGLVTSPSPQNGTGRR
jgi:GT2 family glycosyltransferase